MIIFTQRIVNKLSFGAISLDLTCFYLGGWGKYSSIAGFGRCSILCHSERMRRIAISRQYCPVGLEFQNTFTPVIASGSEAIYCLKKITSSGENSAVEFLTSTFAPPRNDVKTGHSEALTEEFQDYTGSGSIQNIYPYPGGAAA